MISSNKDLALATRSNHLMTAIARSRNYSLFRGLTYDKTAAVLNFSSDTVDRELRLAKAWLYRELEQI